MPTLRVITWNLFHGRDAPPEGDERYAQVSRSLRAEFAGVLAGLEWDVALLQEAPPRWLRGLGEAAAASGASALTSRNSAAALRGALADWNADLMASGEGGSNQVLWRAPWRLAEIRRLTLVRRPERRRMLWVQLRDPSGPSLCVANLHATADDEGQSARDVLVGAERASTWSHGLPLLFGGDLNLRPRSSPDAFARLARDHGLEGVTAPGAIDHLLAHGLAVREPPVALPAAVREVADEHTGAPVRLSDHAPVAATYEVG